MNKDNEKPVSAKLNKIELTMHPSYTGKGNNYPRYDLVLKLNWQEMVELRDALRGKNNYCSVRTLLDAALIDVGAPIEIG